MAPTLNFLPPEQLQSKNVRKVGGGLKILAACFGFVCMLIAIGGTAFILYKNNTIAQLSSQKSTLESEVIAQESSEQTLVLLRDRLQKLQAINAKNTSNTQFLATKTIFDTLPSDVVVKQFTLADAHATFGLIAPSSQVFANILTTVQESNLASFIDTMSFNPSQGFQINFETR